jgi:hypothetical protein
MFDTNKTFILEIFPENEINELENLLNKFNNVNYTSCKKTIAILVFKKISNKLPNIRKCNNLRAVFEPIIISLFTVLTASDIYSIGNYNDFIQILCFSKQ